MADVSRAPRWTRHFVYRAEITRTTWLCRFGIVAIVIAVLWFGRGWWTVALGRSLVCDANTAPSDAMLVENFDPDFMVFKRAGQLRMSGAAARVLVPIETDSGNATDNPVRVGTAEVMARLARIEHVEMVPIRVVEPISLNAAYDVLRFLQAEHLQSVLVLSPLFRSRRSALVYGAVLRRAGITVRCEPVEEQPDVEHWTRTWHGVQEVAEQWIKLQYYRIYVLPFHLRTDATADRSAERGVDHLHLAP